MLTFILILMLALFQVTLSDYLVNNPNYYQLDSYTWESDGFRAMALGELLAEEGSLDPQLVAAMMVEYEYDLTKASSLDAKFSSVMDKKPIAFQKLVNAYETVLSDLKYFPIPQNTLESGAGVVYENGW